MSQQYAITTAMNGNQLRTDPETGLLYSCIQIGFTLEKKLKCIEIAPKYYPDISLICDFVGISKNAYKAHYMLDKVFRAKMDAIAEAKTDEIEAAMAKFALQQGNFMDRIAWLRAHRGEKYNEKKIVQIQQLSSEKVEEKKVNLLEAVDAELVEPTAPKQIDKPASLPNQ